MVRWWRSARTADPRLSCCSSAGAAAPPPGAGGRPAPPVVYLVFDVLWLDGRLVTGVPLVERRGLLEGLGLAGSSWQTTSLFVGQAAELVAASRQQGLEGVVVKRLQSPYRPGRRSADWRKLLNYHHDVFMVGGYVPGPDGVAALLVGDPDPQTGRLRFVGRVDHGLLAPTRRRLAELLARSSTPTSPFQRAVPSGGRWGQAQGRSRRRCSSTRSWRCGSATWVGKRAGCVMPPTAASPSGHRHQTGQRRLGAVPGMLVSIQTPVRLSGGGAVDRCGFCGSADGPFTRVQGAFTVLMCPTCLAQRSHGRGPYPDLTDEELRAGLDLLPTWVLAQEAAANRRVIAAMRQRLERGEPVAPMYGPLGLAWLQRQAEIAEQLIHVREGR